ncbi:MAG TPA: hypothetical protein VI233_17010, partial [Puia sp.]
MKIDKQVIRSTAIWTNGSIGRRLRAIVPGLMGLRAVLGLGFGLVLAGCGHGPASEKKAFYYNESDGIATLDPAFA